MALGCQLPFISPTNTTFPFLSLSLFPICLRRRLLFAAHNCHRRVYIISVATDASVYFCRLRLPSCLRLTLLASNFRFDRYSPRRAFEIIFYTIIIVYPESVGEKLFRLASVHEHECRRDGIGTITGRTEPKPVIEKRATEQHECSWIQLFCVLHEMRETNWQQ